MNLKKKSNNTSILMKMIRVEGVVLREQPIKEQDRLVTILTKEQGLLSAFANGARNPKSRNRCPRKGGPMSNVAHGERLRCLFLDAERGESPKR